MITVVIDLQYTHISDPHSVQLKLIRCYMSMIAHKTKGKRLQIFKTQKIGKYLLFG